MKIGGRPKQLATARLQVCHRCGLRTGNFPFHDRYKTGSVQSRFRNVCGSNGSSGFCCKTLRGESMDGHHRRWLVLLIMFAFALSSNAQVARSDREAAGLTAEQAGQLRTAFDDYVAALQALSDAPPAESDLRLRDRIIKLALKLDPPPAVPDEAQRRITNGQTATKSAEHPKDINAAISEFQGALRIAPWLPAGYFDIGELQEKLRDYPAAIRSFEFYLLAAPTAQNAESVQKRIIDLHGRFPAMYL